MGLLLLTGITDVLLPPRFIVQIHVSPHECDTQIGSLAVMLQEEVSAHMY